MSFEVLGGDGYGKGPVGNARERLTWATTCPQRPHATLGVLLNDRWGHDPSLIQATSLASYQGPPRAPDTTLDCSKLQSMLSFPLPGFETWLRDHPECLF